jgi:hypothetical protein
MPALPPRPPVVLPPAGLTVELVSKTSWYNNVRALVDERGCDRIRRQVYRQADHRCEICGGRGPEHPVECHEVWRYDDRTRVQLLVRMIALCPACHQVKLYPGRARRGLPPDSSSDAGSLDHASNMPCQRHCQRNPANACSGLPCHMPTEQRKHRISASLHTRTDD